MNSSFVIGDQPAIEEGIGKRLEQIKQTISSNPDKALKELESMNLSMLPKKSAAEVYWLISECLLKEQKFMKALAARQLAVDLDPDVLCLAGSAAIFEKVDKVIKYGSHV